MTLRIAVVLVITLTAGVTWAQLPPPNGAGVSAGHEHFRAMAVEAATRFWTALGGVVTPVGQGKMNIEFSETRQLAVSTRGRGLDHIDYEVRNLEAFMRKLSDGGVNVVRQFGPAPASYWPTLKAQGNVLDPWGTYIELLEGFADVE